MHDWNILVSRYFAGEASPEEKQKLEQWVRESDANRQYVQQFKEVWESSEHKVDTFEPDVSKAFHTIQKRIDEDYSAKNASHDLNLYQYARRLAAVLIVGAIGITLYWVNKKETPMPKHIATAINQRTIFTLFDGTVIWLNSNSSIDYPPVFANDVREITLHGEAYFDVAKDASKPFIIHTGNTLTKVVGTSFDIKQIADEEATTVTVTSGKVVFYSNGREKDNVYLVKGDRGVIDRTGIVSKQRNEDLNFRSWQDEKIIFDNTSFEEAARVLSGFYHASIVVNQSLLRCRITSVYDHQTLDAILDELQSLHGLSVNRKGDNILLSGAGCE